MKRCVIVGAAPIGDYERVNGYFGPDDFFIFCDGGLCHEKKLGRAPDLIVGDFDSHKKPQRKVETIILPREKDDTDTVFAAKEGLKRGFKSFLLIGCVGKRLDHTAANVSVLLMLDKAGARALMLDDFSEMETVGEKNVFIPDTFPYFSLLALFGSASGVTVKNAKFPLENAEITSDYQYGVSNEAIPGKRASVSVKNGRLLLVKVL